MPRSLPSINSLLATVVLACVVPMAALLAVTVAWFYHSQRAERLDDAIMTAHALMSGVDEKLHTVALGLTNLSHSAALADGDLAAFETEARAMAKAMPLRNIALVDAQGRQIVNTRAGFRGEASAAVHPRAAELLDAGDARVLDGFRTPVDKRFVVGVGIAVRANGAAGHALVANIDPADLGSALHEERLPPSWIVAVLDSRGTIVGRTRDAERVVGTPARDALIARIREVPEDAVESVTVDGVPVITAFSRSPHTGWSIAVGMPRADLVAPLQRALWLVGAGSVVVLAITLAFSRRLARRISDSLRMLAAEARSVGHRTLLELPPPAFAEADQLGQALLHADTAMHDAQGHRIRTEAMLEAVLDSAEDAVVVIDEDSRIVAFNRAAVRMFGAGADDVRGQPVDRLLPGGSHLTAAATGIVHAHRWSGQEFIAHSRVTLTNEHGRTLRAIVLKEQARATHAA